MKHFKKLFFITSLLLFCNSVFSQSVSSGGALPGGNNETKYKLIFSVNAPSYRIEIDNKGIRGNKATVSGGNHVIKVTADGYSDWINTININRNQTINVSLARFQHRLSIQTNTSSSIYINDRMVGNNSYSGALDPGTYSVVVRSNGFMDYKATVVLDRDTNLVANLQPLTASVSIYIPPELLNNKIGGAMNQVKIYDNGKFVNAFNLQLTPGNHTIRIESGGFAIEGNYNFEAGRTYNIEPVMFLNIK